MPGGEGVAEAVEEAERLPVCETVSEGQAECVEEREREAVGRAVCEALRVPPPPPLPPPAEALAALLAVAARQAVAEVVGAAGAEGEGEGVPRALGVKVLVEEGTESGVEGADACAVGVAVAVRA